MTSRRDNVVVASAVALVVAVAALVVFTVVQAERNGRAALEDLQEAQVEQLARSMDTRLEQVFTAFQGIVAGPWHLTARHPADSKRLQDLQALNPNAKAGYLLADASGVVVNGTLLRDEASVGRPFDREGIESVLAGTPAILPVGPGLTTAQPTLAIAYPISAGETVTGVFVVEAEVAASSAFNEEVSELRSGRTGEFMYLDQNLVVVASSNPALLGRPLDEPLLAGGAGLHRGNGRIVVSRPVPSSDWLTVFRQTESEFEGELTRPLRSALLTVVLTAVVAAGLIVLSLARRLRRAREEQRRLEDINVAREEFISIVSHEMRTPVVGLLGFLQTTLDHWDGMGETDRRRAVSRAWASARRLHSLTRDVLDSSTLESGQLSYRFEILDLRAEVSTAVIAVQEVQPSRTVTLRTPDEPTWVRADSDRIQQVLTNVLDNAVKSSPPHTPIEVVVERTGDAVQVRVTDYGPGLSDDDKARVFEKFVRGRGTATQGTGLGLYICRQILQAHDGSIGVVSSEGLGATFEFSLPVITAPAEPVGA